jgi:acyl dehydratase
VRYPRVAIANREGYFSSTCLRCDSVQPSTPVFIGDTLYAESKILNVRDCVTREHHGTVVVHRAGRNQHGMSVIEFIRTIIVKRREAAVPYKEATDRPGHREFS